MKGCNVQEGQGKKLFHFPKNPERRSIWVSRTGQNKFWQPRASCCICENHFDASQWERIRLDGCRVLRHLAVPLPAENNENISSTMYDHGYSVNTRRRHPFQDLTTQMNRLSEDHIYASLQLSKPTQAAENQVIRTDIAVESVPHQNVNEDLSSTSCLPHDLYVMNSTKETSHELSSASAVLDCDNNDLDSLSILANVCAASESIPSTANFTVQELQNQLKKQKEEIKTLQDKNKLLNTIIQKAKKRIHVVKSNYDKCRLRL